MTQHTPGPWCTNGVLYEDEVNIWNESETHFIGSASIEDSSDDECRANARLMAAAPDLLEAATELLALMDSVPVDLVLGDETDRVFPRYEFAAIRAAVAKATG